FLIDPEPYDTLTIDTTRHPPNGDVVPQGIDAALLQQRADFLRPDSLVAVLMITDENDCSIVDAVQAFYSVIRSKDGFSVLTHGTTPCLTNPNDKCCFNCQQETPPQGCGDPKADPECIAAQWTQAKDPENLRCWHQKQRYGLDFLYPIQRYV